MTPLKYLQDWYQANCDGDWEHNYGIKIETLDNPGWAIIIDLVYTDLEGLEIKRILRNSDTDWMSIITKDKQLIASGDPQKLEVLLSEVKKILEENYPSER